MEETHTPIPAVLPEPPEPITAAAPTAEQDISIIDLLGAPTERKAESWEAPPEIDENLPGFDPPPPSERATPPDPDGPTPTPGNKKDVPQELVSEGAHLMAPAVVEIIDAVIPPVINIYAKGDDPTLFCADEKAKGKMSEALADLLGSKNVQLSPGWIFALTIVAAYAPAGVQAYEMRKLKTKLKKSSAALDEERAAKERAESALIDAERRKAEALTELQRLKLENAELAKKTATREYEAKNIIQKKKRKKK